MSKNPNKELDADQVVALFHKNLPHLVDGLGADRSWIWWSGPKPEEAERKLLLELGFSFTPRPHTLPDGRVANWFHAAGGVVIRRGRKRDGVSSRQRLTPAGKAEKSTRTAAEKPSDAFAELQRIANALS